MLWILTGCSAALLIGCMICAALAFQARNECIETENSLRRYVGRIAALEAELEVLQKQLQKLRGKLYATKADEQERLTNEIARPFLGGVICENWKLAQRDGPRSAGAKCECDYCTAKRAEREALRAQLVPRTAKERADALEKGSH